MARSLKPAATETASYHGEIWTDARGYATVRLPAGAGRLLPPLEYELCDLEAHSSVRVNRAASRALPAGWTLRASTAPP